MARIPEIIDKAPQADIKPARGEEKEKFNKNITDILDSPGKITRRNLVNFIGYMILLRGGSRKPSFDGVIESETSEFPLHDKKERKSITFSLTENVIGIAAASIRVGNQRGLESQEGRETVTVFPGLASNKLLLIIRVNNTDREFFSYVTGKKELAQNYNSKEKRDRELNPSELKNFLTKVYRVHNPEYTPQSQHHS